MKRWTKEELEILNTYYPKGGYFLCKSKGLKRNRDATLKKAQTLNLKVSDKDYLRGKVKSRWSDWELDILKSNYVDKGKKGMEHLLPHRTYSAIYLKATELGLYTECEPNVNKWTKDEVKLLLEVYPKGGTVGCIAKGLNRSECAILKKANTLGIKMCIEDRVTMFSTRIKNVRCNYELWTEAELDILKTYFEDFGAKECIVRGINRDISSIYRKAKSLGLKTKRGAR